eukprot:GHVU01080326.1.p3 GENE.GHVU01080326.1~~GHVU01080326.1.p3  ORF type:complete len:117 (-),score=4.07 GHVU01080326.1:68-418(-)
MRSPAAQTLAIAGHEVQVRQVSSECQQLLQETATGAVTSGAAGAFVAGIMDPSLLCELDRPRTFGILASATGTHGQVVRVLANLLLVLWVSFSLYVWHSGRTSRHILQETSPGTLG